MVVRGRSAPRGVQRGMTVAIVSALATATVMSGGFSYYLSRQQGSVGQHRVRLKAATDRNALLQSELLKLNSSVVGVMSGLDTVSLAVSTAKLHLQRAVSFFTAHSFPSYIHSCPCFYSSLFHPPPPTFAYAHALTKLIVRSPICHSVLSISCLASSF